MLLHKIYETEEEHSAIVAEMEAQGFTQVSTEGYFIGEGHLLFDDGKPEPPPLRDYETEIVNDLVTLDIDKMTVSEVRQELIGLQDKAKQARGH